MDISDQDLKQIAKIVRLMAETGRGTDYCLEEGCLPLKTHFYSPVPDLKELEQRKVWDRISPLSGLNMQPEKQIELLTKMAAMYSSECKWPQDETSDPHLFHWKNHSFSFQCASMVQYMIRYFKPKRIIEIGSGYSSRVINAAIGLNKAQDLQCHYEIVDPYPAEATKKLKNLSSIEVRKVEELSEQHFLSLGSGDILFVDSGHVVKTGSDVNFLVLDVLPILQPGVIIHFHDIHFPMEYPKVYFTNPAFRMFWTEGYLLQAFLACNNEFEVLAAAAFLQTYYRDYLPKIFPNEPGGSSGSLWIRRLVKH